MTPTQKRELQIWKLRREIDAEQLRDARELPHQQGSGFHLSDLHDKELTFQPAVNPLSVQIAEVRNTASGMINFGDRLHNESKTWRKKSTENLKKEIEKQEMKECTRISFFFSPLFIYNNVQLVQYLICTDSIEKIIFLFFFQVHLHQM